MDKQIAEMKERAKSDIESLLRIYEHKPYDMNARFMALDYIDAYHHVGLIDREEKAKYIHELEIFDFFDV